MLVVCSEGHDPVSWDPAETDECWMCGRSIRVPPRDARYSEDRGDKDRGTQAPAEGALLVRQRAAKKRK